MATESEQKTAHAEHPAKEHHESSGHGHSRTTTDPDEIRKWVEGHGGRPATVKSTHQGDDIGLLRIDFPGYSGEGTLEEISWDEFFAKFDESELAFLYQDGKDSRFNKLIKRGSDEHRQHTSK